MWFEILRSTKRKQSRSGAKRRRSRPRRPYRRLVIESLEGRIAPAGLPELISAGTGAETNTLSGFVYIDQDRDGIRDPGESGVPGAQITLRGTDENGDSVSRTTLTLDNGQYLFDEVLFGTYELIENQPAALGDGLDTTSIPGAVTGNDQFTNIVLSGGDNFTENNFGESSLLPEYISIRWFLASTGPQEQMLREAVALGEEKAGNTDLAAAIRDGETDLNNPPLAADDSYGVEEDGTLTTDDSGGVLANDTDADGDALTATLVSDATNGSLDLDADGSFTYTPDTGFTGADSFTYQASDGSLASSTATVIIDVQPVAEPPTAVDDSYDLAIGATLTTTTVNGVLANDTGSGLTAEIVSGPEQGQTTLNADGTFTYTQTTYGFDQFVYEVTNSDGLTDQATVTIQVPGLPPLPDGAVITTQSNGLEFYDFVVGTGASPGAADTVTVGYVGYLPNGDIFDSRTSINFLLLDLIAGFSEGVQGMQVGGSRRIIIPPDLGYGLGGNPGAGIGGTDTIVFDVDLIAIV